MTARPGAPSSSDEGGSAAAGSDGGTPGAAPSASTATLAGTLAGLAAPPPGRGGHRGLVTGTAVTVGSVVVGLLAGAALITAAGGAPGQGYTEMVKAAFGGRRQLARLLIGMAPLLLMGLGYAIAYRARFLTIGAQGQFDTGAIAAGALVLTVPLGSGWAAIPLVIVVAAVAGGAVGAVAGVLKTTWGVNEIITSLMLNYLAFYLLAYVVRKPLSNPEGFTPESAPIPSWAELPTVPGTRIHLGVILAVALVPAVWWAMRHTRFGFGSRIVGASRDVAGATGVDVSRTILQAAVFSGALAGIAGGFALTGSEQRLSLGLSSGIGFTAIVVALLGRLHPLGIVLAAALLSALALGGQALQRTQEIPASVGVVVNAVMVLLVLLANRYLERRP